jgi:hypothetical protein
MAGSLPDKAVAVVHSVLPPRLEEEVDSVLGTARVPHRRHSGNPVEAGASAAADPDAVALLGPFRSRDVAETVEVTAPAGLPLIAPVATWAGVTRDDEPGCFDDPAAHRGTVFRLVARDTVVAARIAEDLRGSGSRAFVVAGSHEYGEQLDAQLDVAGLERTDEPRAADVVVLCGLEGEPEVEHARALAPLPVIAFDGVQGSDLGDGRDVLLALPFAPNDDLAAPDLLAGVGRARAAAELAVTVIEAGARDRAAFLEGLRALNAFDEHGDPLDPPVWLWRAGSAWSLTPERALGSSGLG